MVKTVIFVGGIRETYIKYFFNQNYTVGYFIDKEELSKKTKTQKRLEALKDYIDFVIPINFESKKSINNSLSYYYFRPSTLMICIFDRYLLATSYIINYLETTQARSLPVSLARNGTNKINQRKVFKKLYPEISPEFRTISSFHGAYLFVRKYGFPVIIKPANLSQSQLVNICEDLEDLIKKSSYVFEHVAEVYKKNKIHRRPQVGIEEYIKGKQYSVDSYVSLDGEIIHTPVCQQAIGYDLGYNNFETIYSSYTDSLSKDQEKLIFETVSKAIKALEIKGNPTHTEVRLTSDNKCKIIEVNIRTGGFRTQMLEISYGINHPQNVINTYLNLPVIIKKKLLKHSTTPQFWSPKEGTLKEIRGVEDIKKLESFVKLELNAKEGEKVGPANYGYHRAMYVILAHKNKKIMQQDIQKVRELISFDIEHPSEDAMENFDEE